MSDATEPEAVPKNPHAFPCDPREKQNFAGMTLRDYFAAAALTSRAGFCTSDEFRLYGTVAQECYTLADDMLRVREGGVVSLRQIDEPDDSAFEQGLDRHELADLRAVLDTSHTLNGVTIKLDVVRRLLATVDVLNARVRRHHREQLSDLVVERDALRDAYAAVPTDVPLVCECGNRDEGKPGSSCSAGCGRRMTWDRVVTLPHRINDPDGQWDELFDWLAEECSLAPIEIRRACEAAMEPP